ncbi:MAG: transcriptional repressor LexA [Acidiferrobacter sp.]
MTPLPLTARQRQLLAWIAEQIATHGRPPTRAEIATALGFRSANAAQEHLQALARKGAITLTAGARGIQLPAARAGGLPVVGRVAAGQPILAYAHITAYYPLDRQLFRPPADYLLTVVGDSMREAGILDGDLLAVQKTALARPGQIVVVRLEDEVTVKRWSERGTEIWLLPENPAYVPIIVAPGMAVAIEGIGVGVLRLSVP